jgi:hypothetical protein
LSEGGGERDGDGDGAGDGVRRLTGVNAASGEAGGGIGREGGGGVGKRHSEERDGTGGEEGGGMSLWTERKGRKRDEGRVMGAEC